MWRSQEYVVQKNMRANTPLGESPRIYKQMLTRGHHNYFH